MFLALQSLFMEYKRSNATEAAASSKDSLGDETCLKGTAEQPECTKELPAGPRPQVRHHSVSVFKPSRHHHASLQTNPLTASGRSSLRILLLSFYTLQILVTIIQFTNVYIFKLTHVISLLTSLTQFMLQKEIEIQMYS